MTGSPASRTVRVVGWLAPRSARTMPHYRRCFLIHNRDADSRCQRNLSIRPLPGRIVLFKQRKLPVNLVRTTTPGQGEGCNEGRYAEIAQFSTHYFTDAELESENDHGTNDRFEAQSW